MTERKSEKSKEYWMWYFFSTFCFVAGVFLIIAYVNGDPHVRRGIVMSSDQNLVMAVVVWAGATSMLTLAWKDRQRALDDMRAVWGRVKRLVIGNR